MPPFPAQRDEIPPSNLPASPSRRSTDALALAIFEQLRSDSELSRRYVLEGFPPDETWNGGPLTPGQREVLELVDQCIATRDDDRFPSKRAYGAWYAGLDDPSSAVDDRTAARRF